MKEKDKKTTKKTTERKKSALKKTSYIGVFTLVLVGLVTVLSSRFYSRIALPSENSINITLPTQAPLSQDFLPRSSLPTPAPPVSYKPEELPVSALPAEKQETPFQIVRPVSGDILVPYSADTLLYSKTLGDWRTHTGIDFFAEKDTEVKAAADGVVLKAYQDPLMGYTVVLSHSQDFQTIYQNLSQSRLVSEGETVTEGQAIGTVGESAPAELLENTHLHFSLKSGDSFVNPIDYVKSDS
ncbi:MAG: M23 family metallopeptidase [Clostridia bacterium]|nr:M23 family metallopeptidase [Clostridia bacterium]